MFAPDSIFLLWLFILLVLGAIVYGAHALGGRSRARVFSAMLAAVVCVVMACGITMNRNLGYASKWSEVPSFLGFSHSKGDAVPVEHPHYRPGDFSQIDSHPGDKAWDASFTAKGSVLSTRFRGPRSGLSLPVDVWLPKDYSTTNGVTYRVIVMLHGYPGNPKKIPTQLDLDEAMKAAPNTIVVVPSLQADGKSPDCVDLKGRPAVGTWVTSDVVEMVRHNFPTTASTREGWTIAGASAGAYCASVLGLTSPHLFSSIIAFSGYDDPQTGLLQDANAALRERFTVSHLLIEQNEWNQRIYVTGTLSDSHSVDLVESMEAAQHANVKVTSMLGTGGHNWNVWRDQLPGALEWLVSKNV